MNLFGTYSPMATVRFGNLDWVAPGLATALFATALIVWSYRAGGPERSFRMLCMGCKILGIAALLWCLLEPLWKRDQVRPGANLFAVVADNSQGMQIIDAGADQTRGEMLQAVLRDDGDGWQKALAENFRVRRFTFDARLQDSREGFSLAFDGRASAIGESLRALRERFEGRPLAGVLLLTDGIATDQETPAASLAGMPPVYPVIIGRDAPVRDVAVTRTQVARSAFEDAPITVRAEITARGMRGASVFARIEDATGKAVSEQTQVVHDNDQALTFRFQFRPQHPGITFYRLRTGAEGEPGDRAVDAREATLLNNQRVVAVDPGRGPYRILYVSGRPNWEYKFLSRALVADEEIQLVGLIRIALREPRFDFRGRAGETSNPLFRGFGDQSPEEAERYDQPVLTRLNTRDERELSAGFPRDAEELFTYHAIVVDDVEAAFFDADQAMLMQHFVSERGGGVLMLGGMETFGEGGYLQSPIGDMLPVYLDREAGAPAAGPVAFGLTREGWLQTWARLRDNETAERSRLDRMPRFHVLNPAREVKPAASLVATATDEQGEVYPALATQRFGRGRTAALMIGDLWRWGMQGPDARQDLDKFWRQTMRWLVADVPRRVDLAIEEAPDSGSGGMRLQVRTFNESFQPLDDATVSLDIRPMMIGDTVSTGAVIRLQADPDLHQAGLYRADYLPRRSGGYLATVVASGPDGDEIGRAEAGWSTDLEAEEFRSLRPDLPFLEELARLTGGEVVSPDQIAGLVDSLPARAAPMMESHSTPLWHTPWVFLFAVACFVTEWGLRRSRGLP